MPDSASASVRPDPPRWYWTAPYVAVVIFALTMLALAGVLQQREMDAERSALARDVQWVEQTLRGHLQATEEFLSQLARDLAAGVVDHDTFQLRANQHIADNPQLANIAWVSGRNQVRWTAPFDTVDWLTGETLGELQRETAQLAVQSGRRAYSAAYRNARGVPVFEVHFPVLAAGSGGGVLVGMYSVERLLRHPVPSRFLEKYRLSLRGPGGELLAATSSLRDVDERLDYELVLDPPGNGLHLGVSAFRAPGGFSRFLPTMLILGLSVLVLWSLWSLRRHVQQRVQAEKERDRLFNLSLDMLSIVGQDGRFRRCNPAFERVLGHAPEGLTDRLLIEFVHADDVGATLEQLRRLGAGEPAKFENRCRCADGSYRWLAWSVNPVSEEKMLYAVAHDITGRKATEEALRAEFTFRKAMEDSVITGLRAIDLHGRIIYVNSAFCRMVGYDESELVGVMPPFPYWPPESVDDCARNLDESLAGQAPTGGFDLRIRRKNGECFDARFYLSPLIDVSGRQTGWMASVNDVTEARRVRAALEAAHERFEAVLDGLDAAVFVADARTDEILFANRAFKRIHGFDAVGRTARGVGVPRPQPPAHFSLDPRLLRPGDLPRELFDGELQNVLSGRWYHVREQATRWVDGRVVRMGIATDITDRKQTAEVAREQEERLQRTSRLITMGEMASTLAHELNQPLSAIANYCAGCVTRMQGGQWKQEELLAAMQKASFQAERAGKIIRRVREFVKKSEPRRSAVKLTEIIDDALAFADIDARRTGIVVERHIEPGLPPVFADRIMIEQVLLNLIRNGLEAMAETPRERRRLVVRARRLGDEGVEVAVVDRGHGISEESRKALFTPFYTTKAEGMGMGLNICRSIVEFHDGRLVVDANPEGGTIFSFTLPMEEASEQLVRSA